MTCTVNANRIFTLKKKAVKAKRLKSSEIICSEKLTPLRAMAGERF